MCTACSEVNAFQVPPSTLWEATIQPMIGSTDWGENGGEMEWDWQEEGQDQVNYSMSGLSSLCDGWQVAVQSIQFRVCQNQSATFSIFNYLWFDEVWVTNNQWTLPKCVCVMMIALEAVNFGCLSWPVALGVNGRVPTTITTLQTLVIVNFVGRWTQPLSHGRLLMVQGQLS